MGTKESHSNFDLGIIWNESAKKYGLKKRDHLLWTVRDHLIFSIFSHLSKKDDDYYLNIFCYFKPLWADDLFWKIVSSYDYSKAPMSFRVIGSNIAPLKEIYQNKLKLGILDMDDARQKFDMEIETILQIIETTSEDLYHSDDENPKISALVSIHNNDYKKAKKILRKKYTDYKQTGTSTENKIPIDIWNFFRRKALKYIAVKRLFSWLMIQ